MKIAKNLGTVDRVARIVAGIVSLLVVPLAFIGPRVGWAALGLIGLFPLIFGVVGYCPPYALFGINTWKQGRNENDDHPELACC